MYFYWSSGDGLGLRLPVIGRGEALIKGFLGFDEVLVGVLITMPFDVINDLPLSITCGSFLRTIGGFILDLATMVSLEGFGESLVILLFSASVGSFTV